MVSGVLDFAKLSGSTNYREWSVDMSMLLRDRGLLGIVTGTEVLRENATPKDVSEFNRRKDKAISIIYRGLEPQIKPIVAHLDDPATAWTTLKDNFEPSSKALIGRLLSDFYGASMEPGENISVYIARLNDLVRQLANLDCKINNTHLAYKMMSNLPEKFNLIVQHLHQLAD